MRWFEVKFPFKGGLVTLQAETAEDAMQKAHAQLMQPTYCRIHAEIADRSSSPVGQMGLCYPRPIPAAISAQKMREIYVDCGTCLIPDDRAE